MQQWRKLRATGIEAPNPRKQTLTDLVELATNFISAGHEIIILIDANSPTTDPAIEEFLETLNLHDLTADYLPDTPPQNLPARTK